MNNVINITPYGKRIAIQKCLKAFEPVNCEDYNEEERCNALLKAREEILKYPKNNEAITKTDSPDYYTNQVEKILTNWIMGSKSPNAYFVVKSSLTTALSLL